MHLGRDFWWIVKLLEFIMRCLKLWSQEENEDTPKGEV